MELALVNFVGAGVAAVSTGLGYSAPPSAIRNGYNLVEYLAQHRPAQTSQLVEEIAADLWSCWDQGQVAGAAATFFEPLSTGKLLCYRVDRCGARRLQIHYCPAQLWPGCCCRIDHAGARIQRF